MTAGPSYGRLGRHRVYTFYSCEAWIGKSMATVGVAALLSSWGGRVLVVDWDLDSPGIERFLSSRVRTVDWPSAARRSGILDLVEGWAEGRAVDWRECVVPAPVAHGSPPLSVLTAGRRDGRYLERLERLRWDALFAEADLGTYLERLRTEWALEHDYVLVDSPPGMSEGAGICTVYLPDVLVAFLAGARSVEGIADVTRRARRARGTLPFDRGHLVVVPVRAWDESRPASVGAAVRLAAARELEGLFRDFLHRDVTAAEGIEVLRVPHVPPSLAERDPVVGGDASGVGEIGDSYATLARLVGTGLWWDVAVRPEAVAGAASEAVDFFVSFSDADRRWARWIAWELERAGYRVLMRAWDLSPDATLVERMALSVRSAARTITVLSPAYLRSVYGSPLWLAAFAADPRGMERRLLPVRVAPCEASGPLARAAFIDLAGVTDEAAARRALLDGAHGAIGEPVAPPRGVALSGGVDTADRPGFPAHGERRGGAGSAAAAREVDPAARRRAVAGIVTWVSGRAREAQTRVQRTTPVQVLAALVAAALAPFAQPLLTEQRLAASPTGGQLGAAAGPRLSALMADVAARLRAGRRGPVTTEDVRDALADALVRRFADPGATELRREATSALAAVRGVETALTAAFDSGVPSLQEWLARALVEVSATHIELGRLRNDVVGALDGLQRGVTEVIFSGHQSAELNRQLLLEVSLLRRRVLDSPAASDSPGDASVATVSDESSPYPGLAPFQVQDARWFHGREALTMTLVNRLAERMSGPSLVVLVGASGAGKSSLLNAGLLPALRAGMLAVPGSETWPHLVVHPGSSPVRDLAIRVATIAGTSAGAIEADLRIDPTRFGAMARRMLGQAKARSAVRDAWWASGRSDAEGAGTRLVLVVDQFEEVFTQCPDPAERQDFIRALCAAASPGPAPGAPAAVVVLGLRADLYAECTAHPELLALLEGGQVVVGPMTTTELRRAIERPAEAAGLHLEPGLVDVILRDLDGRLAAGDRGVYDPGRLPLLSHALLATWERRRDGALDLAGYQRAGGIDGAITTTAERLYESLSPDEQRVVRSLLLRLVVVTENPADDARARVRRSDLLGIGTAADRQAVETGLNALIRARLVAAAEDHVELTHEALLHAWPRLRSWIDEGRDVLVARRHLAEAAASWERTDRDPEALYGRVRLAQVHERLDSVRRSELGAREAAFLIASETHVAQRERIARWRVRGLSAVAGLLGVLLVVTTLLAVVAQQRGQFADEQRRIADSRQLAAEADALRTADPATSALLAVEAFQVSPTVEARSSLLSVQSPSFAAMPAPARVDGVAVSPDGHLLAGAGHDGGLVLWDATSHRQVATLHDRTSAGPLYGVAFSPDGRTVAAAEQKGAVELWDVASRDRIASLTAGRFAVNGVAFSPDGSLLAAGGNDGAVSLWDVRSLARIAVLVIAGGPTAPINGVAFSPDGRTLASASADTSVVLWDVVGRSPVGTLSGHTRPVRALAMSGDGRTLATGGDDGAVRLWDLASRTQMATLITSPASIRAVAFAPDGRTLAAGSDTGSVRLWDVRASAPPVSLGGPTAAVAGLAFGPDGLLAVAANSTIGLWYLGGSPVLAGQVQGQEGPTVGVATSGPRGSGLLATAAADHVVRVWKADGGMPFWTLPVPPVDLTGTTLAPSSGVPFGVAFSPDGRTLAVPVAGGDIALWHLASRQREVLAGDGRAVKVVAFSPDGRLLAAAGPGPGVTLWDVRRPGIERHVADIRGTVNALAFSPDGRILASASDDGTISLSKVRSGSFAGVLIGHLGAVETLAFSPNGRMIASGGADGAVDLWDVGSRRLVAPLPGHSGSVVSVAFSPDGRTIASASADHTIRLWTVSGRAPLATLAGHGDVTAVAFASDGTTLVGADLHGTPISWDTDASRVMARICAGHPGLTLSQWSRYVPADQPYRRTCP